MAMLLGFEGCGLFVNLAAGEAQDFVEGAAGANLKVGHELARGLLAGFVEFLDGGCNFLVARGQARRADALPPAGPGRLQPGVGGVLLNK